MLFYIYSVIYHFLYASFLLLDPSFYLVLIPSGWIMYVLLLTNYPEIGSLKEHKCTAF